MRLREEIGMGGPDLYRAVVALTRIREFVTIKAVWVQEAGSPAEVVMAEKKKWVRGVKTVSTSPPKELFTKDAETIARAMASKKVSPKGIGSGIRMIQFYINRAGKNLAPERKRELENAKRLLQEKGRKRQ
jgi:tRNA(adenine34) deaminase